MNTSERMYKRLDNEKKEIEKAVYPMLAFATLVTFALSRMPADLNVDSGLSIKFCFFFGISSLLYKFFVVNRKTAV